MNHLTKQVEYEDVSTQNIQRSDSQLISLIINNNAEAFTELYNRYNKSIQNYVSSWFRKTHFLCSTDVDEVVQMIWTTIYQRIKDEYVNENQPFRNLLFTVARNHTSTYYTKRKKFTEVTPSFEDSKEIWEKYGSVKNIEAPYDEGPQIEKLLKILYNLASDGQRLSAKERDAYIIKVLANYTTQETQELLNLSENCLKVHLHNARNKLTAALKSMGIEELRDIV